MITRAVLRGEPAGDPAAHVAGLPVLLRQLLSLQAAGVRVVAVQEPESLPADPRLNLRFEQLPAGTDPRSGAGAEPALLARPGLVWHPNLPPRLIRSGTTVDLEKAPLLEGEFVAPTATPAERDAAERLLLGTLCKPTDGVISRSLNRRVSLWVSRSLLETAVTPNQMTLLAAAFGFSGIAAVLAFGPAGLFPGALLVQAQSILDGCDGEISRLKYLHSRSGEWLDQVLDDVVNLGFFAAAGWTLYRQGSSCAGWLTLTGVCAHLVYQTSLYAALLTRGGGSGSVASILWWGQTRPGRTEAPRAANLRHRLKVFFELAGRRDVFTFLYVPATLAGATILALAWAAVVFTASGVTTGLQWLVAGGPERA
jgi:phosphatidylglycerophosphate synthase